MSAPSNNNRGQAGSSQPPHVVQTILESFTRCFAPIDECSSPSSNHSMDLGGSCYSSGITGAASATGGGGGCDGRAAVSRSISSSNDSKNSKSRNNDNNNIKAPRPQSSTTTNNEGRRKSSSNSSTRPIPTAEELNERSMKRKLEIFRGSGQSSSRVPTTTTTTTTGSRSNNLVQQQDNNRGKSPQSHQTTTTSDDDDDEEILRLTQNSARNKTFGLVFGGCGLGHYLPSHDNNEVVSSPNNNNHHHHRHGNSSSPLFTNLGRKMGFGTGGQWSPPGFLCFATPVRSNSGGAGGDGDDGDNLAHVSDDKLTADEFLSRHGGGGGGGISYGNGMNGSNNYSSTSAPPSPKQVSPEHNTTSSQSQSPKNDGHNSAMSNQGGSSVYTEITDAQTIESTLYFDQRYSHVIQTRPPMPLFQENIVTSCGGESYYDCGTNTTTITGSTGGGGGGSSFLFGEGLFSNSKVGNEISTIYNTKKNGQVYYIVNKCEI